MRSNHFLVICAGHGDAVEARGMVSGTGAGRPEDDARRRIIDAAGRCFARFGMAKTTMQDIADEAGLTRRSVYNHFANQADILTAIAMIETERLNREVAKAIGHHDRAEDTLTEGVALAAELSYATPFLPGAGALADVTMLSLRPESAVHQALRARWSGFFIAAQFHGAVAGDITIDQMVMWLTVAHSALRLLLATKDFGRETLRSFIRTFVVEPILRAEGAPLIEGEAAPLRADDGNLSCVETQILEAAVICFTREAPAKVTMARVAAAAGLGRATLYRYFRTGGDLYRAALEYRLEVAFGARRAASRGSTAGFAALAATWMLALIRDAQNDAVLRMAIMLFDPVAASGTSVRRWLALLDERDIVLAPDVDRLAAGNWLAHSQRILLIKAESGLDDDSELLWFARRFCIESLLPAPNSSTKRH